MDRIWSTPEDVEADLARAAGGGQVNVHEGCLLYGERPPPPSLCHNEDADIELQFGPHAARTRNPLPRQAPDLGGITHMLRMIQKYGTDEARPSTSANDVILVSKLNPNVKEFMPRPVRVNETTDDVDIERNATHPSQGDDKNNSNVSEIIDEDKYRADREELEAMLKSKIQRPAPSSGQDGFQFRQEKYCAIAKLLKLHSTRPPAAVPVQLRTPDYFRSPGTTSAAATTPTPISSAEERVPSPDETATTTAEKLAPNADEAVEWNPLQVEASIHKVTNWLDSKPCVPCPPRVPVVPHLGPVAYKRKQQRSAAPSPASLAEGKQARAGCAYVPSALAAELGLQYAGRAERAERDRPAKLRNVWEKLEEELRRKDQLLKARGGGAPDSRRF